MSLLLFPSPLRDWIFQQVRFSRKPFQRRFVLPAQLAIIEPEPFADKHQRRFLRVAVRAGGFINGLQQTFQRVILWDAEEIVPMDFPQVKGYPIYVLLDYVAAKAVIIIMGGDKLP